MTDQVKSFDQWGIVEVMGHKKYAGHITEQTIGGASLLRVDVPEVTVPTHVNVPGEGFKEVKRTVAAYSKLIGVGSIYMITPTSEDIATKCAAQIARYDSDPLPVSLPVDRQLPASTDASADLVDDDNDLPL